MSTMFLIFLVAFAFGAPTVPETKDDLKKWRVRELSDWAESRGLKCKGCAEKADWVDLVWNNKDVPEKEAPKVEEEPASDAEKDAQFAEIEKMLEKAGVKGKAFNRKEMEKMLKNIKKDPEQEGKKEEEKKDEL